jgi:diguanylate cyclase (GGDEF)-like protein
LTENEEDYLAHENPIICANGVQRIVTWRNAVLRDAEGCITGILSSGTDVTELRRTVAALSESERSKSVFISHIPGIAYRCAFDHDWTVEFISDGCKTLSFNDLICEQYREIVWQKWNKTVAEKSQFKFEYQIQCANGETKWVFETGQPIYAPDGSVEALEGILIDIDESKQRYNQILYMNDHDFLTGLYNRRYFEEKKKTLDLEENLPLAIITADINGVRIINDAFGHKRGDELIMTTADILNKCRPKNSILARTGGDEFNIIVPNADKNETQRIVRCIRDFCADYNDKMSTDSALVNISLGYGIKEGLQKSMDEVLKEAEDHMLNHKLLDRKSHHNSIISSIMATMYARSQETEQHAERLAELSIKIGHELRLPHQSINELQLVSMLHDIGKIGIDDSILNKPGPLTQDEWEVMKRHPEIGYRIAILPD